jgi:hypothetical protein
MKTSEQTDALFKALSEYQSEAVNPQKTSTADIPTKSGGSYSYSYAPLPDILDANRPLLAKHGLSVVQESSGENGTVSLTTLVAHTSGQWLMAGPVSVSCSGGPQVVGSAITYLRRYSLCAVLGISGDSDDDANVAEAPAREEYREEPKERVPGGASKKSVNYARKLFVDAGVARAGKKGEPEDEKLERRDNNKLAVREWLLANGWDELPETDDPLEGFNQGEMSAVIDALKARVEELAS